MFKRKKVVVDPSAPPAPPAEKKKRKRIAKDDALYIKSSDMYAELEKYHASGVISEELGVMFMKLAKRYTSAGNLSQYTYRDEFMLAGVARMISQIDKFNMNHPTRNPFAYFTEVLYKEILNIMAKEKKQQGIKVKYRSAVWNDLCEKENIIHMRSTTEDEEDHFTPLEQFEEYIEDEEIEKNEEEKEKAAKEEKEFFKEN